MKDFLIFLNSYYRIYMFSHLICNKINIHICLILFDVVIHSNDTLIFFFHSDIIIHVVYESLVVVILSNFTPLFLDLIFINSFLYQVWVVVITNYDIYVVLDFYNYNVIIYVVLLMYYSN